MKPIINIFKGILGLVSLISYLPKVIKFLIYAVVGWLAYLAFMAFRHGSTYDTIKFACLSVGNGLIMWISHWLAKHNIKKGKKLKDVTF